MSRRARLALLAAALLICAVYVLSALGLPVGTYNDDALHVLLARSLGHGAFLRADGAPETRFLPGMAALLALPARLIEPRWGLLRLVGVAASLASAWLSWRLLRRALSESWAAAGALLVALNAVLVDYAGSVMPDVPALAATLACLLLYARASPRKSWPSLAAAAAAASFIRPECALLPAAFALCLWLEEGFGLAARLAAASGLPLALWLVRNRQASGLSLPNQDLWSQGGSAALGGRLAHAGDLLVELFGRGLLGLSGPLAAACAIGALAAAALGARRVWREPRLRWARPAVIYAALFLAVHAVWRGVSAHYLIPILPVLWLLVLLGLEAPLRRRPAAATALAALALAPQLARDWPLARLGFDGPAAFQPATMAWLREHAPADALVESPRHAAIILWTGRACRTPGYFGTSRDAWLADALTHGVSYAHVEPGLAMTGVFPEGARAMFERMPAWGRTSPYLKIAFDAPPEGALVLRVSHPRPERYLEAWKEFNDAAASRSPAETRAHLLAATRLEPTLAYGWAALAELETDPRAKRKYFEKAALADPTDPLIADDLASERGVRP